MNDKATDILDTREINIIDLLHIIWKHKIILIALVVLFSSLMIVITAFYTDYTYTSYCVLHISNKKDEVNTISTIEKNDIETSKTLSTTYKEILKTRAFLKEVSDAIGKKYSIDQIGSMSTMSTVNDTELLKIEIKTKDPKDSFFIAETFAEKAPVKLLSVYKSGEIEIVDPPVFPEKPDGKGYVKKTLIGFMLGLILGVAYAVIYDLLDKKVHKSEDVAKRYDVPVLGETAQSFVRSKLFKKSKNTPEDESKNILNKNTDFDTIETYKYIRTNIMFSTPRHDTGKVIVVTSASPGEGKTTTTINLAITFAQTDAKVLLIDCDLRRSRVHRYLGIERKEGVSNVLCGYTKLEQAIQKNVRENVDCLSAGETPPNPAELLQTEEFQNMLSELQRQYDYIFIDTPPVTVVADAVVLTKKCDGIIVVARSEMTTYDLLDTAMNELKNTDAKIIGTIIHESSEKQKKYGYYKSKRYGAKYAYKYAYRYGYGEDN